MKKIEIKKGSWHYELAEMFGWKRYVQTERYVVNEDGRPRFDGWDTTEGDFCSYVRKILLGVIIGVGCTVVALAVTAMVLTWEYHTFKYYFLCVFYHSCTLDRYGESGVILNNVVLGFSIFALCVVGMRKFSKMRGLTKFEQEELKILRTIQRRNEKTFLKAAYSSLKDKVCYRMEIK